METDHEHALLENTYQDLCPYINFFQPVLKLIGKEQIGNKVIRRYDTARTPYQRVIEREDIPLERKARLLNLYLHLNPTQLRRHIDDKVFQLWEAVSR